MSWSISIKGTPAEALTAVNAAAHIDASVVVAIKKALCAFDPTSVVELRTHGHITTTGIGNVLIQIDTPPPKPRWMTRPDPPAVAEPEPPAPSADAIVAEDAARIAAFTETPPDPAVADDPTADEPDAPHA